MVLCEPLRMEEVVAVRQCNNQQECLRQMSITMRQGSAADDEAS
jgi:hypothetical protein